MTKVTRWKRVVQTPATILACALAIGIAFTIPSSAAGQMKCKVWRNAEMHGGTCIGAGRGCGTCTETIIVKRTRTSDSGCSSGGDGDISCRPTGPQVASTSWSLARPLQGLASVVPGQVAMRKIPACSSSASLFDAVDPRKRTTRTPAQASMPVAASVFAEELLGP